MRKRPAFSRKGCAAETRDELVLQLQRALRKGRYRRMCTALRRHVEWLLRCCCQNDGALLYEQFDKATRLLCFWREIPLWRRHILSLAEDISSIPGIPLHVRAGLYCEAIRDRNIIAWMFGGPYMELHPFTAGPGELNAVLTTMARPNDDYVDSATFTRQELREALVQSRGEVIEIVDWVALLGAGERGYTDDAVLLTYDDFGWELSYVLRNSSRSVLRGGDEVWPRDALNRARSEATEGNGRRPEV